VNYSMVWEPQLQKAVVERPASIAAGLSKLDLFLDTCRLTRTPTEVVQLRSAYITTTLDRDRVYDRAIGLEYALYALTV
jgi:hypothetical protein